VLVIGLPDLPFHLRLDNLSAVFALLLGFVSAGISILPPAISGRARARRPA
jgi:hydrogenase-4 component B